MGEKIVIVGAVAAGPSVADNLISGRFRAIDVEDFVAWLNEEESHPDWLAIDLRHPAEAVRFIEKFQMLKENSKCPFLVI